MSKLNSEEGLVDVINDVQNLLTEKYGFPDAKAAEAVHAMLMALVT